ncbi:MAG: diguanylate cyclase [Nitrospinae bacterium]|nr:diguanylate cyclase [Nitrospinota bacterium]
MTAENKNQIKALVIDDEPFIKNILTILFEMEGYSVLSFDSGLDAFEQAKKSKYDIIISDYFLPHMDGIELIQKVKELHPYIASILITGVGDEQTVIDAFTKGHVNSYITKPFNNEEIIRIARLALKEQEIKKKEDSFQEELKEKIKEATKQLKEKNELLEKGEKETKKLYDKLKEEERLIKKKNILLQKLSVTDGLTGLYNHRYFQRRIKEEFIRAKRYNFPLSCLMVDLDDFKILNDTHGHQVGDRILTEFSMILNNSIREVDMAARYGGEEFVVLLPQINIDGAAILAERFRMAVELHKFFGTDKPFNITISIGVSTYPAGDIKTDGDLLKAADTSLYRAKNTGKNRVVVHTIMGEKAVGGGEILTIAEKRKLLSDITMLLNRNIGINELLKVFLNRLKESYDIKPDSDMLYAIMLIAKNGEPYNFISTGVNGNYKEEILANAREVVKSREIYLFHSKDNGKVFSAIPIITDPGTNDENVIGVLNISTTIEDKDFIKDISNILSIAIKGAKKQE